MGLDDGDAMDGVMEASVRQDPSLLGCSSTAHLLGMLSTDRWPLVSLKREMESTGFSLSYEAWRGLSSAAGAGLRLPHPIPIHKPHRVLLFPLGPENSGSRRSQKECVASTGS